MPDPATIAAAIAKYVGPKLADKLMKWARRSETQKLVRLLQKNHPAARKLLVQPSAVYELYLYAETGRFNHDAMFAAVRAVTKSDEEAEALVDAIREQQWKAMHDERREHFELRHLRDEIRGDLQGERNQVLARLDETVSGLARALPAARSLPAQTSPFADRGPEVAEGERLLAEAPGGAVAVVLACSGMAGVGKSAFALELAYRHAAGFEGGVLYVDLRAVDGSARDVADTAARLLLDLGVAPEGIPREGDARVATLRSLLAEEAVMLLLDNAVDVAQVRDLIPSCRTSVVIITSQSPLVELGAAHLLDLGEFGVDDGIAMLEAIVGARVDADRAAAAEIVGLCGGLPLALAVVAGRARRRPQMPLRQLADSLREAVDPIGAIDDREQTLRATLTEAVRAADLPARRLLLLLAALDVIAIEVESAAVVAGVDEVVAGRLIDELEAARLLAPVEGGGWRIHQLVRALARSLADEETAEDLVSAQRRRVDWLVSSADEHAHDLDGEV